MIVKSSHGKPTPLYRKTKAPLAGLYDAQVVVFQKSTEIQTLPSVLLLRSD